MAEEGLLKSLTNKMTSLFEEQDGEVLPTSDSLLVGQKERDDEQAAMMREASEYYQALAGEKYGRDDFVAPKRMENPDTNTFVDVTNILMGDLMAAGGMTLDKEGLDWSLEQAKDFWGEHPVRAGTAVALNVLPAFAAISKPFRVRKFADLPDDMIRMSGLVDEGIDLAKIPNKQKTQLKQLAYQIQETRMLNQKIEGQTATALEKVKWQFQKSFGNNYIEQMSATASPEGAAGISKAYADRMQGIVKGEDVANLLENLPDASAGTAIAKYLNDPNELANVPKNAQPFAVAFAEQARRVQAAGLRDGIITEDTFNKVGDVWFSTQRKGTVLTNEGVSNSIFSVPTKKGEKVKLLTVPRTNSPHLLEREATKTEVSTLLNRQEAAEALEAGDRKKALNLLKGKKDDATLIKAIEDGDDTTAMGILGQSGFIDTAPANLTVKSLLQQTLLHENFRFLRDISMNPAYAKTGQEYAALSKQVQKRMKSLDSLPNANILRRMVGKKQGLPGPVESLGYVHEDVFRELTSASTGQPAVAKGILGFVDVLTSVHKVNKTALNFTSHGTNLLGNYGLLAMSGWNPFSVRNTDLIWNKSLPAIRKLQNAARAGKGAPNIVEMELGEVASQVGGAPISIAEEMASVEVGNLVEKSSMLASEGVEQLHRLYQRADKTQNVLKSVISGAQKVYEVPPIAKLIDMYSAEDGMMKLAYYLDLRSKGLSRTGASLEVARRLPMYNTVGTTIQGARRGIFPWITFPVEAMRIVKNNMMDYPLRSYMFLHAVDAMQAMTYPALNESFKGMELLKEGLPTYANKSNTLLTPLRDANGDLRAATIDMIPWSAFMPQSESKDATMREMLPAGLGQPFPILEGLLNAATGQDSFGRPIATEPGSILDKARVITLGTLGVLAPPIVSKYALSNTAPNMTYRAMQDFGKAVNPYTTKPGDPIYDVLLNNIGGMGVAKFYPSSPEQMAANASISDKAIQDWRAKLTRNWNAAMRTGDMAMANQELADIKRSFLLEWKDPAIAQRKEADFFLRHIRTLRLNPQLASYSKERLIQIIVNNSQKAGEKRSAAYQAMMQMYSEALANRSNASGGSTKSNLKSGLKSGL